MKKKVLKIIALIVAIALIIGIASMANALNGNPISRMLAKRAANAYLEEHYPNTDYYIEDLGFSFKFIGYYAHVRSDSSMDTQFTLEIDMLGHVFWDTYESVTGGFVTARRIDQEYRELCDQVFESATFPYPSDIAYGSLEIYPQQDIDDPAITEIPDYYIVQEDLILDHIYDPRALGAQAGRLVVYVETDTISAEAAARVLLDIRKAFDEANIPFRAMDFVLEYPLPEEGPRPDGDIRIENFPYEQIGGDDLAARIEAADAELDAIYAAMDAEK